VNILVDMNLSPEWCKTLRSGGVNATHGSEVGDPRATDAELMEWASINDYVVLTNDLDFGAILASTQARGPSVIQLRAQRLLP